MTLPCCCTVEDVAAAMDIKATAYMTARIARATDSATRSIEGALRRRFYPQLTTLYFDWPPAAGGPAHVLWLEEHELISVTSLTSGGNTIDAADFNLEPFDGPPYNRIELDLSSSASFGGGSTPQRDITIVGVTGYRADTAAAGALAEALDSSETGVDVTDSSLVGIGDAILVGTEYMVVTGRAMLDTGVTIAAADSLTASTADVSLTASTTTGIPQPGEVILIDAERLLVVDLAGDTLSVRRAWDGSTLAAHAAEAPIYAGRTLTVERGALGSTAAAHDTATAVLRHVVPGLIRDLGIAESIVRLEQENAGYARTVGSGEGTRNASLAGLADLRAQARRQYRRVRSRVI